MKEILKIFFPLKKNYEDFISYMKDNNINYKETYDYPEYLFEINADKEKIELINENFKDFIFANENKTLIDVFHETILKTDITVSGVESCSGGLISKFLTDKAGASKYFKYSVVSYSNEAKNRILNISLDKIKENGVVSKAVIIGMLEGLEYIYPTDMVYAVSGIAGPSGGSKEKPVGTVYIGIVLYGRREIESYLFEGNRWEIRRYATWTVLLKMLNKIKGEL